MRELISNLIQENIKELETRDVDQFYECTQENAEDLLGRRLTRAERDQLYIEVETRLNEHAGSNLCTK